MLSKLMSHPHPQNDPPEVQRLQQDIEGVQNTMGDAIQQSLQNGDNLEDLQRRAQELTNSASTFHRHARKSKQIACYRHYRFIACGMMGAAFVIYVFVSLTCRSWTWDC